MHYIIIMQRFQGFQKLKSKFSYISRLDEDFFYQNYKKLHQDHFVWILKLLANFDLHTQKLNKAFPCGEKPLLNQQYYPILTIEAF